MTMTQGRRSKRSIQGKLGDRVVAITGAARGIGRATAAALAGHGARVAIGDLDLELAQGNARELGERAIAVHLDVTDRASFVDFLDETERQLGPVDVLINNAGIMPVAMLSSETDSAARRIVDVNLHGVIIGSKLALERMLPHGRGHIINIASQAGKAPFGGMATYCATKHAIVGFTGSLADEMRDSDINASCILPAIVRTELSQGLPNPRLLSPIDPDDVADAIVATIARPRRTVHVPRTSGVVLAVLAALTPRSRRILEKALGMERGVMAVDPSSRSGYEARAAREVLSDNAHEGAG